MFNNCYLPWFYKSYVYALNDKIVLRNRKSQRVQVFYVRGAIRNISKPQG